MAQFESILGDQPESSQPSQNKQNDPANTPNNVSVPNKQNNVTEFNSQPGKNFGSPTSTGGRTGAATAPAKSLYDQAKQTAGQAYEAVTDTAATKLDEQKSSLSGGLTTVADSVRQVSENLTSSKTDSGLAEAAAKYTNTAAQKLEDVAGYFETRGVREMARDLEGFARRNPAMFLGAAFGLGFLAARFLKSSPRYDTVGAGREFAASAGAENRLPASTSKNDPIDSANRSV